MNLVTDNFSAEIVADSINPNGVRLTSFAVTFPRMVLAELNTHRKFSRNSASSRAVPFQKMRQKVLQTPFIPLRFQKNHKGMQGTEYLVGEEEAQARKLWLEASQNAVEQADKLFKSDVTKQLCNRLLEPFLWHTVLITSVDYENFFKLRAHEAAEIHIQKLAYMMLEKYNNSIPKKIDWTEWHIPFGDSLDTQRIMDSKAFQEGTDGRTFGISSDIEDYINDFKVKIATARCARISYFNFEGKDDYDADIKLHDSLIDSGHFSPTEHLAMAKSDAIPSNFGTKSGWQQYRKMIPSENAKDPRVKRKQYYV